METGVGFFATHDAIGPDSLARLVEERGHESLFFAEHTHIPANRASPYPGGGELPRKYAHTYDLFVALTAAAVVTTRLRVGSGVCLVVERDPIITAKEVASVDRLSGGRFEFGVGAGWNREEMVNHGTDPRRRMAILAERVEAMKQIWTQDEASYAGEHVAFDSSGPGPSQPSGPIRQSWSVATAPQCSTACSPSEMPGSPTTRAAGSLSGARSCAPEPSGRSTSWSWAPRPIRTCSSSSSGPDSAEPCTGFRRPAVVPSNAHWSASRRRSPTCTGSERHGGAASILR